MSEQELYDTHPEYLDSFTVFPKLLPELRIIIWQHALLYPRLVLIHKHSTRTNSSTIRRNVFSPLLSVSRESRIEAIRYYFPSSRFPRDPSPTFQPQARECLREKSHLDLQPDLFPPFLAPPSPISSLCSKQSFPIFPSTDILYISGHDGRPIYDPSYTFAHRSNFHPTANRIRGRTPVTWTLFHLAQDLEDKSTFAPPGTLAIDLSLLQTTPITNFTMPHGIWRFVICDLSPMLENLYVVRPSPKPGKEAPGWGVDEVVQMLRAASWLYLKFWEGICRDEGGGCGEEISKLKAWKCPNVRLLTMEDLAAMCWV